MIVLFFILFAILLAGLLGGTLFVLIGKNNKLKHLFQELDEYKSREERARTIIATSQEIIQEAKQSAKNIIESANQQVSAKSEELRDLESQRQQIRSIIAELANQSKEARKTLSGLLENIELCNLNFYTPHYNLERALDYERALRNNRSDQKALIKAGEAIISNPSKYFDKKVGTLISKLLLRTFNSECDLLIQNVDYKNVVTFENRINNSFEWLNKQTENYDLILTSEFLKMKMEELRIYHEFQEKKQSEAEEQRQIKEIMREEIRAERELEKAKAEAEKEEQKYQALLDKMLEAAQQVQGAELDRMNAQIAILQQQLEDAKEKERRISQAQLTKAGYVYVISNVGAFGENIFKIGLTRRLEPQERVDELGDASVPFKFDVHAMIYHENAPDLENKLHQVFEKHRVNKINLRKEFFRVSLDEIEQAALQLNANVSFTKIAEAKEYRQSIMIEKEMDKTA